MDNTLVAGRCVSSDRYIRGSIRVMPGCYITGQAAGIAAAMAAKSGASAHDLPVRELQKRLKKSGAYLPNC
ncbi:MAG: FAD-dependent oxidoreductase [Verrucomicrobiae bacterium]|nr:FAD-dependent oxidoreductase [Verrucomicrobiae bacterium]